MAILFLSNFATLAAGKNEIADCRGEPVSR